MLHIEISTARFLAAILILLVCLGIGCTTLEIQGLGYDYRRETYLATVPNDSTRAYLLKVYRIIEMLDDSLSRKLQYLDAEYDRAAIDSLVEAFIREKDFETRPDTPNRNEWWDEIWNVRAAHCDSFYHTTAMKQWWDIRARPVIMMGLPESEQLGACETCGLGTCQFYAMDWMSKGLWLEFIDAGCDGDYEDTVSSREIFVQALGPKLTAFVDHQPKFKPYPEVTKQIKSAVDIVSFPDSGGFALWVSSGVGLNQYVPDSAQMVSFHQQITINRMETVPKLVYLDSTPSMTMLLPDTTEKLDDYWYPVYLGGCILAAGTYDIFLTLYDDHAPEHRGAYRATVTLPTAHASKDMSDILVALKPAEYTWEAGDNRIVRGKYSLMGNPAYYHRGDSIHPYVEFDITKFAKQKSGEREYSITASLYRAKETFGKPTTEIGSVFEVSHDTQDTGPSAAHLRKPRKNDEAMIFSASRVAADHQVTFQAPIALPSNLPAGKYYLVVAVQDSYSRNYLTGWREIRIKK